MPTQPAPSIPFPGTVIATGSSDRPSVVAIQKRLNILGCGPVAEDGTFGSGTAEAVELFQTRFVDHAGAPLQVDSRVGPTTWSVLFGVPVVPSQPPASALLAGVLSFAGSEIGTLEQPLGSNRGPRVDQYLRAVGIDPASGSFPWCAAFVYFCFRETATRLGTPNPLLKTASVLDHWNRAGQAGTRRISAAECADNPGLVQPGMIFILSTGNGSGHTGLVESVAGVQLTTLEGNTNMSGSREGIGVFRHTMRRLSQINKGFLAY
jgi:hypothetical protein